VGIKKQRQLEKCGTDYQDHLISTQTEATYTKVFTLKHLKSLQHISILRSSSGS